LGDRGLGVPIVAIAVVPELDREFSRWRGEDHHRDRGDNQDDHNHGHKRV